MINSKKIILFISVYFLLFIGSGNCFAQGNNIHDFGIKYDQAADKVWTIQFTEEVDDSTIQNGNISVVDKMDNSNVDVTFTKSTDNKSIIVTPPAEGYKSGHTYLIYVRKDVKSSKKENLKRDAKLEFKIIENQQTDSDVKFIKAMGENAVVVQFNSEIQQSDIKDVKVSDENNKNITSNFRVDYGNNKNLIIYTSEPMYTPSVYNVKIGDKTYKVSAIIDKADAVKAVSAEAVGEKIIKVKLNRPIEQCDLPEVSLAENSSGQYVYANINYIDNNIMDVTLENGIHKGEVCSLNINGQVFNVEGTIDDTNKVKAVAVEQSYDAPGRIDIKLNRKCFDSDKPDVRITDDKGQELSYDDFQDYDLNNDILTVNITNAEKQVGSYKVTVGDNNFDINLKSVSVQVPEIASVQAITSDILKITYNKQSGSETLTYKAPKIKEYGNSDDDSNIYTEMTYHSKNTAYTKLNTSLVWGHTYILTDRANNKDFTLKMPDKSMYDATLSNISSLSESSIKFNLNSTLPEDIPSYLLNYLLINVYNQYGNSISYRITSSSDEYMEMSFNGALFKPDSYYIECNNITYDIPSVINKSDALKVTSMNIVDNKTLVVNFSKKLDSMPHFLTYDYYDNGLSWDSGNSKISNNNSLKIVYLDPNDLKTCKIVINGTCYYVKDYVK